jgi:hypothetical protein
MLIKNMMEDLGEDAALAQAVPIPNVSSLYPVHFHHVSHLTHYATGQ